jgi:UDP-N-acetylmuramoyl-tripeptide--D-alanyl-D-alanine ligase
VGPDVEIDGASFDSRTLLAGQLFVPIVAERDGHEFVPTALAAGAPAYLSSAEPDPAWDGTAILVADTAAALMDLAAWARRQLEVPVVGVTGSVGKTTTKDLVAAAIGATRRVAANERSFNNEQGLPVTILGAPHGVEALVVEMGMRGFGEIARLCEVASPTVGVVTIVASAHTERVGGIDGVAAAKRELVEALPAGGTAVLNADDHRVAAMAHHTDADVIMFGSAGEVKWSAVELDELARARFHVETPWGRADVSLAVTGAHMVMNAAAAITVAGLVEGRIDDAVEALSTARLSGMRMEVVRAPSGALVINDAYNANPESMRAALRSLARMSADRRFAVLGAMGELDEPEVGHRQVMADARDCGVEVVAVGTELYGVEPTDDPVTALGALGAGDVVLVKASRAAGLERVAAALTGSAGT